MGIHTIGSELATALTSNMISDRDRAIITTNLVSEGGEVYLRPGDSAAENATNFQAAADATGTTSIILTPGIYDYEAELFLYGEKSLIGMPGAIMRITADMTAVSSMAGGGFLHLGTEGVGGPINTWTNSVMEGIEFQATAAARCRTIVYQHSCNRIKIQNCFWNFVTTDIGDTTFVDGVKWCLTSGKTAAYVTAGSYGTFLRGQYLYNQILMDQQNSGTGNGGVGLRAADYDGLEMIGNTIQGVGDDPLDAVMCDNVAITNNYVATVNGRIILNACHHCLVANNRCVRTGDRDGTWIFGALIGSKTFVGAAAYDASGPNGTDAWDFKPYNIVIANNVLVTPASTKSSSLGIQIGHGHNLLCEGNVLWNSCADGVKLIDFISLSESSVEVDNAGFPIAIRNNENVIIRNNTSFTDETGGRCRIIVGGNTPDTVQTVTIDATGGTFTLTYTDANSATYETTPIAYDATAATLQTAMRALTTTEAQGINTRAVTVSGSAGGPYTITFVEVTGDPVTLLISDATALTGGAGTAVVADATGSTLSAGEGIRVEGNMCTELSIAAADDITVIGNKVGDKVIAAGVAPELIEFGHDNILWTSSAATNYEKIDAPVVGQAPLVGYVGANGFRLFVTGGNATINGVEASGYTKYAVIPANSTVICTPQSTTNWVVETLIADGTRAAATMVS